MAISSLIIQSQKGTTEAVKQELSAFPQISLEAVSPKDEIIALIEEKNLDQLHKTCQQLEKLPNVLGVYISYLTTEDEEPGFE